MKVKFMGCEEYPGGKAESYDVSVTDHNIIIPRGVRRIDVRYNAHGEVDRIDYRPG